MPGHDWSMPALLGYMGLGSGIELLPYFVALLGVAGAALLAIVQRPLVLLVRWLRKSKRTPTDDAPADTGDGG